jgi:hypothetical protein
MSFEAGFVASLLIADDSGADGDEPVFAIYRGMQAG